MGILKGIIDRFRAMGKTEKQKARKKHERGKGADGH